MEQSSKKIIIKLEHPYNVLESRENCGIQKVSSSISPLSLIKLLNVAENKINPRTAKVNAITKAIHETLEKSPELFWLKTKGVLVATTELRELDRNRVELTFEQDEYEGIMDGGHNTFAVASYIVSKLFNYNLKEWSDCKTYWREHFDQIVNAYEQRLKEEPGLFDFTIPVEIISPSRGANALESYYDAISEICAARNNNIQLKETAKGNQEGHYDYLKQVLTNYSIVWKTNETGNIKAEDVVTMADIPLTFLQEKNLISSSMSLGPVSLYSNKGQCIKYFSTVLSSEEYSESRNGKMVLNDELIKSALDMTEDIMKYFDQLTLKFPDMYNKACRGRFRGIAGVKADKEMPLTFHTQNKNSETNYALGFIYPLVSGLKSLMRYNKDANRMEWIVNPSSIAFDLDKVDLSRYTEMMKLLNYNPNVIGKTALMYDLAKDAYRNFIN